MKKLFVLLCVLACLLSIPACGQVGTAEKEGLAADAEQAAEPAVLLDETTGEIFTAAEKNGFELKLYADKDTYTADEEIHIRATLEYKGPADTVTVWHGLPYIGFWISDGGDFETGGATLTVLTSTELEKGMLYEFPYKKSGGYSENDPDADFWRAFYAEDALKLPTGTYTVSVSGAFHVSEQMRPGEEGPSCALQITVTE